MDVQIKLMGYFRIEMDGQVYDTFAQKSRKGAALIRFLVVQRGRPVSSQRLIRELEADSRNENPRNAMKTLVSRTRSLLNQISPGLGSCIASESGTYRWQSLPGVTVDVLEILDILDRLRGKIDEEQQCALTERLMELYQGELEDEYWLHREYLEAIYDYIGLLNGREAYNRVCEVCERALKIDDLDEQLHILKMEALVNLNRPSEAMSQYYRVVRQSQVRLESEPSDELRAYYTDLVEQGRSLKLNLDFIHNELTREEKEQSGPYFCEYRAFKEIYNIQMRNLERLGSTMFLGVIMVGSNSSVIREGGMAGLLEILRRNLRKGDIVTRFSENIVAMLLPMVNYSTRSGVMGRIEKLFYAEYSGANLTFHSRISPLGGVAGGWGIQG